MKSVFRKTKRTVSLAFLITTPPFQFPFLITTIHLYSSQSQPVSQWMLRSGHLWGPVFCSCVKACLYPSISILCHPIHPSPFCAILLQVPKGRWPPVKLSVPALRLPHPYISSWHPLFSSQAHMHHFFHVLVNILVTFFPSYDHRQFSFRSKQ